MQLGNSLDFYTCFNIKAYCEAFFYGCTVQIELLDEGIGFFDRHNISHRVHGGLKQYNAMNINQALAEYKTENVFGVLGITKQDIFPNIQSNYVYGLSNIGLRTAVISLKRLTVEFDNMGEAFSASPESYEQILLHRACNLAIHEISHIFGLYHCVHYECLLNGTNGPFE